MVRFLCTRETGAWTGCDVMLRFLAKKRGYADSQYARLAVAVVRALEERCCNTYYIYIYVDTV